MLMKYVKEDLSAQKGILCSQTAKPKTVKMSILSQTGLQIQSKSQDPLQLVKLILKLIWKGRRTKVAQTIKNKFLKKEKVGGITLFNFKTLSNTHSYHDNGILAKEQTHRSMGQNSVSTNSSTQHGQLVFDKGAKIIQ